MCCMHCHVVCYRSTPFLLVLPDDEVLLSNSMPPVSVGCFVVFVFGVFENTENTKYASFIRKSTNPIGAIQVVK